MKKDLFKNIGKKINDYQSPVDLDREWNGILNRQQEKKKKRYYWFFSYFGLFLCILAYLSFLYFKPVNAPLATKEHLNSSNIDSTITPDKLITNNKKNIPPQNNSNANIPQNKTTKGSAITSPKKTIESNITLNIPLSPSEDNQLITSNKIQQRHSSRIAEVAEGNINLSSVSLLSKLPLMTPYLKTSTPFIEKSRIIIPNTFNSKRKIQLYINAGLAITQQRFKAKGTEGNEYSKLRSASETPLETYTYDAGINIAVGKKSFLRIGGNYNINFDKINHQYNSPKDFELKDVIVKKRVFYPSNEIDYVRGDTTITGTQTFSNTQFNKYTSANLSASFGYYFFSKNRFSIAATGGLFYNLHLSAKGKVRSSEDAEGALVELDGYKRSFGLGLLGGVDFDYQINQSLILNLRPIASYGLSSATIQSNILKSNFYSYGISIGIKYNL